MYVTKNSMVEWLPAIVVVKILIFLIKNKIIFIFFYIKFLIFSRNSIIEIKIIKKLIIKEFIFKITILIINYLFVYFKLLINALKNL